MRNNKKSGLVTNQDYKEEQNRSQRQLNKAKQLIENTGKKTYLIRKGNATIVTTDFDKWNEYLKQ